jgi:hypothetical protein
MAGEDHVFNIGMADGSILSLTQDEYAELLDGQKIADKNGRIISLDGENGNLKVIDANGNEVTLPEGTNAAFTTFANNLSVLSSLEAALTNFSGNSKENAVDASY